MSDAPATCGRPAAAAAPTELLHLFLRQLGWLFHGARDARRVFTTWLLHAPSPPASTFTSLLQARRLTGPHLAQLEALAADLDVPAGTDGECRAIRTLLAQGDVTVQGGESALVRHTELLLALEQIATCFATACGSAAETALALGRIDLTTVLASWAAAWRDLQRQLQAGTAPAPAYFSVSAEER